MSFEEAYKNYLIYASKQHKKQSFDTLKYKFELRVLPFFKKYNIMYMKEKLVIIKMANTYFRGVLFKLVLSELPPEVPRFFIYFLWLPSTITAMVTRIVKAYAITNSIY